MPVTSTGNYEQSPPGVVVVLTDTGGGDRSRTFTVRYRWKRAKVIVGAHSPRTGFTINRVRGTCQWKGKGGLGRKRFKLVLRSNGTGSSVVKVVSINKRNLKSKTFRHTIRIPDRLKKARKKARRKA